MDVVEVSSADIARIADVRPTAVSNWRKRHEDFPRPIGGTEKSPRFNLSQVIGWLSEQGKSVEFPTTQRLRQAVDSAAEYVSLPRALAQVALMLRYGGTSSEDWDAPRWTKALRDARASLSLEHPGFLDTDSGDELVPAQIAMLRGARTAVRATSGDDVVNELFESYFDEQPANSLPSTPIPLARLMVELTGKPSGVFFDPACGAGATLAAAAAAGIRNIAGQEADTDVAMVSALRLDAMRQRYPNNLDIQPWDALRHDAFNPQNAAAVVSQVPFNDRGWGHEQLNHDKRWEYGAPASRESELAWVQHALWHLSPSGLAALILPPGAANRSTGRRVRRALVTRGALRAVIALPRGALQSSMIAPQLWLLRRPEAAKPSMSILMLDLTDQLDGKQPKWEQIAALATTTWRRFDKNDSHDISDNHRARIVPSNEVLAESVDLTPGKYLPIVSANLWSTDRLKDERNHLAAELCNLTQSLNELPNEAAHSISYAPQLSIDDLEQQDAIRLRRHQAPHAAKGPHQSRPVLAPMDVVRRRPPSSHADLPDSPRTVTVRRGDVLATVVADQLFSRLATTADVGACLSPQLVILRPDPQMLSPQYLAGILASNLVKQRIKRNATSAGIHTASEIRKVVIPVPDIEVQEMVGRLFEMLSELSWKLHGTQQRMERIADTYRDLIAQELTQQIESTVNRSG